MFIAYIDRKYKNNNNNSSNMSYDWYLTAGLH